MVEAHLALAALAAVLTVAIAVGGIGGLVARRAIRRLLDRLILGVLVAVALAGALGLVLLATGHVPTDALHLLYGAAAFVALPIARFALPSLRPDRRAWLVIGGAVVLLGLFARLIQTG